MILYLEKIELETKQDEKTITDFAEKLELESNTNMVKKEEFLQKFVAEDIIKTRMITVAGQTFIYYDKETDNSNQIIKSSEVYIGDKEI